MRGGVEAGNEGEEEVENTSSHKTQGFRYFFSSIPHFRSDRKVLLSPQPPQGKGDGSYNNGGNYRHQDDGEASGGEDDKKINQGEI